VSITLRRLGEKFRLQEETRRPVHSKKSILRMKTAFIDCAEANFLFVVAICIVVHRQKSESAENIGFPGWLPI
jgi:hypothetical protein